MMNMNTAITIFAALLVGGECRFLATPTAAPTKELSIDEQIAAMQAEVADQEKEVVQAGGNVEKEDFARHCKPEARAKLEAASDSPIVEKKEDGPLAAQLEASERKAVVDNEEFC